MCLINPDDVVFVDMFIACRASDIYEHYAEMSNEAKILRPTGRGQSYEADARAMMRLRPVSQGRGQGLEYTIIITGNNKKKNVRIQVSKLYFNQSRKLMIILLFRITW